MYYRDEATGNYILVSIKALDSMPVGTIVEYDGQVSDIPTGWEAVSGQNKIKKTSETTPTQASVVNQTNSSTEDSYSCNYANQHYGGTLLWTNSSPTSSMAGNIEINLSSSDYDILEIYFKSEDNKVQSTRTLKGYDTRLTSCYYSSNIFGLYRNLERVSDTKYKTNDCFYGGSQVTTDNSLCIPLYIVGYKTNIFN